MNNKTVYAVFEERCGDFCNNLVVLCTTRELAMEFAIEKASLYKEELYVMEWEVIGE